MNWGFLSGLIVGIIITSMIVVAWGIYYLLKVRRLR